MTSISQLSNWQAVTPRLPPAAGGRAQQPATAASAPSSIVRLSPESMAAAKAGEADGAAMVLPASLRFKGLGASMLNQFNSGAAIPAGPLADLPETVDNKFTLGITTGSGVKVELALASEGGGMAVQMRASGDVSEGEREALSKLAEGFQAAIDGMLKDTPQVRLGMLAQFDTGMLKSVDLKASVKQDTQPPSTATIAFHADSAQRSVSIGGAAGTADVKVDTSKLAGLDTQEQQGKAIANYLKQFDQAAARGHADAGLMTMFKDAFSDMNRTSRTVEPASTGLDLPGKWTLAAEDRAVLTGLADFSASVTQEPKFSNPVRLAEKDSFSYDVSQSTSTAGARFDDRSVSQKQVASLTAQFHEAADIGGKLQMNLSPESQTYAYHQISDMASSNVELGYKDGRLTKATLQQSASQSMHIMEYAKARLIADKTVPSEASLVRDLLPSLALYQAGDNIGSDATAEQREERRRVSLSAVNDGMFLLSSPADLALRKAVSG